jgi:hypothetical protein
MIVLYTLLMFVLMAARFVVGRRVARLEKKFIQTSDQADHLLADSLPREGVKMEPLVIAGVTVQKKTAVKDVKPDAAQVAKRQLQLGLLVQKRDRLEDKHLAWERRYDGLNAVIQRVRSWKGRKLPYTLGVLDVSTAMYLVDRYGLAEYVNPERVMEVVNTYING